MKNRQLAIIALIVSISTAPLLYADETVETAEKPEIAVTTKGDATEGTVAAAQQESQKVAEAVVKAETEAKEEMEEEKAAPATQQEVSGESPEVEAVAVAAEETEELSSEQENDTEEAVEEEEEEKMEEAEEEGEEEEYDEETYGPEAPIIWMHPVKGVAFVHKIHTMDAGLDCDACHDDFFEMEAGAAEEKEDFIMETIYEGGYCGACHDGDSAFAANTQCATCHIGVMGAMRENGETEEAGH